MLTLELNSVEAVDLITAAPDPRQGRKARGKGTEDIRVSKNENGGGGQCTEYSNGQVPRRDFHDVPVPVPLQYCIHTR